ncbi:hypothetical protein KEJ32_00720 [Candidatus Bathyarchaeota archaeon]|nr:hypothetical protein [Candidatus Bathyarchaeota archaeon]
MSKKGIKFVMFCIGIATAMAASALFLFILCLNLNKIKVIAFESDPIIASVEITLLTFAIATCAAAFEMYLKRLATS